MIRWTESASLLALFGYISWFLLLLAVLAAMRIFLTLSRRRAANEFRPTGEDVSPFSQRLCRAHANCYESFPLIGGILLMAIATGHAGLTDPLAPYVLLARIGQSVTHLISTNILAVQIRFAFFAIQVGIASYWICTLGSAWFT